MFSRIVGKLRGMSWKPLRKVLAGLLGGLTTTGVMQFLADSGVEVGQGAANLVVVAAGFVASWIVPEKPQTSDSVGR